jgi:hypothetical protein
MAWSLTEVSKVSNAFANQQGDVVTIKPTVTNDVLVAAVIGVKHPSPFNLQQTGANDVTALSIEVPPPLFVDNKGNTWTSLAYETLVDSEISVLSGYVSKWWQDGFFPSLYLYTCVPTVGTTSINVNTMYPEDFTHGDKVTGATGGYYSGSVPVFDGGVNIVVAHFNKGASVTGIVSGTSGVSVGASGATGYSGYAGSDLTGLTASAGALIVSLGLMKDGNAFGPGLTQIGGTGATGCAELTSDMIVGDCSAYFGMEWATALSGTGNKPNWADPLGYEMAIASVSVI